MSLEITKDHFGVEYVTIENNGHFTTMLKSTYDEQQGQHSTEIIPTDEA